MIKTDNLGVESFQRNWKKLIFILSLFVIFISINEFVYFYTAPEIESMHDKEIVAIVSQTNQSHQRKHLNSELWTDLQSGDSLYFGDTIRTASQGSLHITFIGKNQSVEIEPDTLLVLQKEQGKIALGVLEGHLFIQKNEKQNSYAGDEIKINTAAVDLTESLQTKINTLFPPEDQEFFLSKDGSQNIEFKWQSEASGPYELWIGSSRKNLKKIKSSLEQKLFWSMTAGSFYWQIRTQGATKSVSDVKKIKLTEKLLPIAVFPLHLAFIKTNRMSEKINFAWRNHSSFVKTQLEVFSNEDLSTKVIEENFSHETNYQSTDLPLGKYYWRLKVYNQEDAPPLLTPVFAFTIAEKKQLNLTLSWQANTDFVQYYLGDQPILNMGWTALQHPAVKSYKVKLSGEDNENSLGIFEITKENHFFRKLKKPGRYLASIEALDDEGERIAYLPPRAFEIKSMPLLAAVRFARTETEVIESDSFGNLQIEWNANEQALGYKYILANRNGETQRQEVIKNNSLLLQDLYPGEYRFSLWALDKFGREGEKSKTINIFVPDENKMSAPKVIKKEVGE